MMTAAAGYVVRTGEVGKSRLELSKRVLWPTTVPLLRRGGVCRLDGECAGGAVARALARMTGVRVGIYLDSLKLATFPRMWELRAA
jgi:hypothetical protein